jgi:ArsR family transcriptional regulator
MRRMEMPDVTDVRSAMGQGTRLEVLTLLSGGPRSGITSGTIAARLNVPINSMSTHLAILLRAGLVRSARSGRNVIYRLNAEHVEQALGSLRTRLNRARI